MAMALDNPGAATAPLSDTVPSMDDRTTPTRRRYLGVTLLALGIAMSETRSVFQLVILSWSTLASAFAPLLTIFIVQKSRFRTED